MPSWLAEIAQAEGGCLRFDRFMELALYHPVHGYYSRNVATVGSKGDFSTTATLSGALAEAIAAWIKQEARALKLRSLTVVELGAGSGEMASGILRRFPPFSEIDYRIVELSGPLKEEQQRRLSNRRMRRPSFLRRVSFPRWFSSVQAALKDQGEALVFSNEFVDAFPCRRFAKQGGIWFEVFLLFDSGVWREELHSVKDLPESVSFHETFVSGQFIEVHEVYHTWLRELSSVLQKGALLTIDYGGNPVEIFGATPMGTIRAYHRHQRFTGREIYLRAGHQDLTADVNFADLQRWGLDFGFRTIGYFSQAKFLRTWGRRALSDERGRFVTDPSGAGSAFRVLHQRIGEA